MSIFMALTGCERAGIRLLVLGLCMTCLVLAIAAARPELVMLHMSLSLLHVLRLQSEPGLGVLVPAKAGQRASIRAHRRATLRP